MCRIGKVVAVWTLVSFTTNALYFAPDDVESGSSKVERVKRSYPQHPIMDMLLQTMALNYAPMTTKDPFEFLRDKYSLPNGLKSPLREYDYVIVGAGSAGCVLASRLTEDPNVTVLLLEVGKPEMFLTDVPSLAPYFQRTDYSWPYYMEPQKNVCLGKVHTTSFKTNMTSNLNVLN